MYTSLLKWAGLAATLTLFITACSKDKGCTDPNAINYDANAKDDDGSCVFDENGPLSLTFDFRLGTADFALGSVAQNWEGRKMSFDRAQFYVSGISFGSESFPERYLLVTPTANQFNIGQIDAGHYHSLSFVVGVDSVANHADPALWPNGHALSSNNPDHSHWGWDPGFIFVTVEGQVDTTADRSGEANAPFMYHIGLDNLKKSVMLDVHKDAMGGASVHVHVDWLKFFEGIDLRANRMTHTMNNMAPAMAFRDNIPEAFSVH